MNPHLGTFVPTNVPLLMSPIGRLIPGSYPTVLPKLELHSEIAGLFPAAICTFQRHPFRGIGHYSFPFAHWHEDRDLNPDLRFWRPPFCHCTISARGDGLTLPPWALIPGVAWDGGIISNHQGCTNRYPSPCQHLHRLEHSRSPLRPTVHNVAVKGGRWLNGAQSLGPQG